MRYKYSGYDATAKKVDGEVEADNEGEVRNFLRSKNVRPLRILKKAEVQVGAVKINLSFQFGSSKPDIKQFTAFIRQLATMQGAGIPIVQALGVLGEQAENKGFGRVLVTVQKGIQEGMGLTDALRKHPKVFDKIFINLIGAGEISGSLDKVLNRLAVYYEKAAAIRRKVISAMTYPVMVIVLVALISTGLLLFVVPKFAEMFTSSGKALPAPTRIVMQISDFMMAYWYLVAAAWGGGIFGSIHAFRNETVRRAIDPYLLKIPIFGTIIRKVSIARFARTLATMIQSGVPILDGLEITATIAGNYAVEDVVRKTKQSISEGNSISMPLAKSNVFPKMAVSMIAIGEQTGSMEIMLTKIAEFYEEEVDATVSALASILEPIMIIIVGTIVAGILIPMYLPIFKMGEVVGG